MRLKVLAPRDVEQFTELGWTKVEEAFPRERALAGQEFLWRKLEERGVMKDDPSTWTKPLVRINETFNTPEFHACDTERLADAIEDLVGVGRWKFRGEKYGWGWWPVNFSVGADRPWDVPFVGWHFDGQDFRHYVDSPNQGLLSLRLFSEVGPHGGGTLVVEGSHRIVAKTLAMHPEGLEHQDAIRLSRNHPYLLDLCGRNPDADATEFYEKNALDESQFVKDEDRIEKFMNRTYHDEDGIPLRVVETTGAPGDVILCHPFIFHATAPNTSGRPRFMCNKKAPLKERMNLDRSDAAEYSPLELSIRQALAGNESAESLA